MVVRAEENETCDRLLVGRGCAERSHIAAAVPYCRLRRDVRRQVQWPHVRSASGVFVRGRYVGADTQLQCGLR